MSEKAAVLNLPREFTFEGQSFKVLRRDFYVEAQFEEYCERRALAKIRRHAEFMTPGEWAAQQEGWRRDVAAESYAFDTPQGQITLFSVGGAKEMTFLRLARCNPDARVTRALVDRIFDDSAKWQELQALFQECDVPNSPRLATPPPADPQQQASA